MIFQETKIVGVWRVALEPLGDERGFFARTFCGDEFCAHGLPAVFEQSSLSRNRKAGTIRGMHYQLAPYSEAKFVRCVRGAIFDVALDIREGSETFGAWIGEELSHENGVGLFVAAGVAHGFQTLLDDTDVLYQITPSYCPGHGRGVRWDDPEFKIRWPLAEPYVGSRDATYPDWRS